MARSVLRHTASPATRALRASGVYRGRADVAHERRIRAGEPIRAGAGSRAYLPPVLPRTGLLGPFLRVLASYLWPAAAVLALAAFLWRV